MSRWFKLLTVGAMVCSSGCASLFDARPVPLGEKPLIDNQVLVIMDDPNFDFPQVRVRGQAWWWRREDGLKVCHIRLRKYPHYLGHEMDHCFREYWHPNDTPNSDDFK